MRSVIGVGGGFALCFPPPPSISEKLFFPLFDPPLFLPYLQSRPFLFCPPRSSSPHCDFPLLPSSSPSICLIPDRRARDQLSSDVAKRHTNAHHHFPIFAVFPFDRFSSSLFLTPEKPFDAPSSSSKRRNPKHNAQAIAAVPLPPPFENRNFTSLPKLLFVFPTQSRITTQQHNRSYRRLRTKRVFLSQ